MFRLSLLSFDPGFGSGFGSFPSTASSGPGASERGNDGFSDISPRTYADLDIDRPLTNFDDSFSSNNFNSKLIYILSLTFFPLTYCICSACKAPNYLLFASVILWVKSVI